MHFSVSAYRSLIVIVAVACGSMALPSRSGAQPSCNDGGAAPTGSFSCPSTCAGGNTGQEITCAPHGYVALAEFDVNRDGQIDSADPVFSSLLL